MPRKRETAVPSPFTFVICYEQCHFCSFDGYAVHMPWIQALHCSKRESSPGMRLLHRLILCFTAHVFYKSTTAQATQRLPYGVIYDLLESSRQAMTAFPFSSLIKVAPRIRAPPASCKIVMLSCRTATESTTATMGSI